MSGQIDYKITINPQCIPWISAPLPPVLRSPPHLLVRPITLSPEHIKDVADRYLDDTTYPLDYLTYPLDIPTYLLDNPTYPPANHTYPLDNSTAFCIAIWVQLIVSNTASTQPHTASTQPQHSLTQPQHSLNTASTQSLDSSTQLHRVPLCAD